MVKSNLELAKADIDDALSAIDSIMDEINNEDDKSSIKEKFVKLTEKLSHMEKLLKDEGILE